VIKSSASMTSGAVQVIPVSYLDTVCRGKRFTRAELVLKKGKYSLLLRTRRQAFAVIGDNGSSERHWIKLSAALRLIQEDIGGVDVILLSWPTNGRAA
jgi:hypothetical protein